MQTRKVLVLLNNSLGEIHFILPYLVRLRSEYNVTFYCYCINSKIYNRAVDDPFYYDVLVENTTLLKPNDLFPFLRKERRNIDLILKDTTPFSASNIVVKIKNFCPNAKLVLFPHAYALLGYKEDDVANKSGTASSDDPWIDKVLYVHPYDVSSLMKRYRAEKLLFAGALGYSEWWKDFVHRYVETRREKLGLNVPEHRPVVLFTLRDVHRLYLNEDNFKYLLRTALDFLIRSTRYFIIIKPHPRQDIVKLKSVLSEFDPARYTVSHLNTFVLSCFSDINLSFWSSSLTDSLAMGIPGIEYHRFHEAFSQTIWEQGELVSFYTYLGLARRATTDEDLKSLVPGDTSGLDTLFKEQHVRFTRIFADSERGYGNIVNLLSQDPGQGKTGSSGSALRLFLYFFLKYLFRKFKPV